MLDPVFFKNLKIPAVAAPMFLVSGPDMVINACKSGIVGSFPTQNARELDTLDAWLARIKEEVEGDADAAPWMVNVVVHPTAPRRDKDVELILKHQPPIVVTALGSPKHIIEEIHGYGGKVLADVINMKYARKAIEVGVDGLVLVSAGAGGHTGPLSGFVFVEEVRRIYDGLIMLGGGICSGRGIRAAEVLGADFAYIGTHFIPTLESLAQQDYKKMVVEATSDDIVCSDALTGVKANWLRQSLINGGYDPDNMGAKAEIDFAKQGASNVKRWKDVWAAGQGVAANDRICPISEMVDRLAQDYDQACIASGR